MKPATEVWSDAHNSPTQHACLRCDAAAKTRPRGAVFRRSDPKRTDSTTDSQEANQNRAIGKTVRPSDRTATRAAAAPNSTEGKGGQAHRRGSRPILWTDQEVFAQFIGRAVQFYHLRPEKSIAARPSGPAAARQEAAGRAQGASHHLLRNRPPCRLSPIGTRGRAARRHDPHGRVIAARRGSASQRQAPQIILGAWVPGNSPRLPFPYAVCPDPNRQVAPNRALTCPARQTANCSPRRAAGVSRRFCPGAVLPCKWTRSERKH